MYNPSIIFIYEYGCGERRTSNNAGIAEVTGRPYYRGGYT
jgi:hypothetical protein